MQLYVNSFQPSNKDIKTHQVLKSLHKNKDTSILKPDKGNGMVVLNRVDYIKGITDIINDRHKFKELSNDPTINREGKLQRFLRELKKKGKIDKDIYNSIYPSGSQPAVIYGLPKIHKIKSPNEVPPFRPIVSSINTYNYRLAEYLAIFCNPIYPALTLSLTLFPLSRSSTLSIFLTDLWFLLMLLVCLLTFLLKSPLILQSLTSLRETLSEHFLRLNLSRCFQLLLLKLIFCLKVKCLTKSMVLLWALLSHLSWLTYSKGIMKKYGLTTIMVLLIFSIDDMLVIFFVFSTMRMMLNYFLTLLTHNIRISNSL